MKEEFILSELKRLVQEIGSYAYYIIGLKYADLLDEMNISQLVKDAGLTDSMSKEIGKAKRVAEVIKSGKYGLSFKDSGSEKYIVKSGLCSALSPESYKSSLLELYKYFITNCTSKAKSLTNYTDFKRLNECIEALGLEEYKTLLDFDNPQVLEGVIEKLNVQPLYLDYNERGKNQYSNAVATYLQFLYALQLSGQMSDEKKASSPSLLPNQPLQQIFYGAPGTGKSHTIKQTTDAAGSDYVVRTTFHPDSDYSTFVGCYKPKMEVQPRYNQQTGEQMGTEKKIVYSYTPQAFTKAYIKAYQCPDKPVYLIIEEINRGNCAQIFGDLFQLLDRDDQGRSCYPIKADQDLQDHLAEALASCEGIEDKVRSGEELVLPPNLYIWATMNTSDQSLFPIDSAFKRRWDWQYMPIAQGREKGQPLQWSIEAEGVRYDWWSFVQKINELIGTTTSSEDKKLGFFFAKPKDGVISADTFVGKVIFYLWNDVFKDYGFEDKLFDDPDQEGKKLTFDKFYTTDANGKTIVRKDLVERFLDRLGVERIEN